MQPTMEKVLVVVNDVTVDVTVEVDVVVVLKSTVIPNNEPRPTPKNGLAARA